MPKCGCCGQEILVGSTMVGMPVIRIVDVGKSAMAGTEIVFHVQCFLKKMKLQKVETLEIVSA